MSMTPHEQRRGRLKQGNQPGDPSKAARCGAKTRQGCPCKCPAMRNGRCRLHGGLSTGARTPEGIERIRRAATKHGMYSNAARAEKKRLRASDRKARELIGLIRELRSEQKRSDRK